MLALAAVNLTLLFSSHLSPDARIILRDDQQWNTAVQQRWSVFSPPTYLGAIKPATEQDVAAIVRHSAMQEGAPPPPPSPGLMG